MRSVSEERIKLISFKQVLYKEHINKAWWISWRNQSRNPGRKQSEDLD